jgi:hypothetical protein
MVPDGERRCVWIEGSGLVRRFQGQKKGVRSGGRPEWPSGAGLVGDLSESPEQDAGEKCGGGESEDPGCSDVANG